MPAPDDEFQQIIHEEFHVNPDQRIDQNPYGAPAQSHKAGLTTRGKAAIAVSAAVIAGGSLMGYQAYSANAAEAEQKASELALQSQALKIEELRELNRASETQSSQDKARQASIDKCVKSNADLVDKGLGASAYRDVVDGCQAQYAGTTDSEDMQSAAASEDSGSGVNQGMVVGVGVLGLIVLVVARSGRRSNAV